MRQGKIQVVNFPLGVVAAVAGDTALLIAVTTLTPILVPIGGVGVLHFPIGRMNIGQRDVIPVAESAPVGRFASVVAIHAVSHNGIVFGRGFATGFH